ncbi:cell division protein ZapE [Novispirillum itersonii]|uniref:cell division protein ZapE n=1 Tax=Novispirillum itersonii TaxID=189 RepID=UPI000382F178|nr:cell division protein ZapE [Novispirillum itersonii]
MVNDPLSLYRAQLARGELKADPVQELAARKLSDLFHALKGYQPVARPTGPAGLLARFGFGRQADVPPPPRGLYLHGPVGRGKSMLMDLFVRAAPVKECRRVHFHEFLRDFHAALHQWRQQKGRDDADPIPPLARKIAEENWLLCLDELEIRDIADAMIVGRIFEELFKAGVVVVTTSNREPDDLYKDGLQREKFLPFIALIKQKFELIELASPTDYRLGRIKGAPVYQQPLGPQATAALDDLFQRMTAGRPVGPATLSVMGRAILVPRSSGDVARFTFSDLCERPLAANDYLHIASLYDAVFIDNVPLLGPANRDAARRFVMLIDALYDHRTLVVMSAESAPETLYPEGDGAFEFQRTVSRLMEMQAESYIGQKHLS